MTIRTRLLESPRLYAAWQKPFAEAKFAPVAADVDFARARRVLDVGCGPGTNAHHFRDVETYLGVDINPRYVALASRTHGQRFVVADVSQDELPTGETLFDLVLMNSLLHHLATPDVRRLLSGVAGHLEPSGHVYILDLVLPDHPGISRTLARLDRGAHPRMLDEWRLLFEEAFEPIAFVPYSLPARGLTLWNMVFFKGRRR